MRVAFVLPNFFGGGAQIVTVRLANWLSLNKDLRVAVIVLNPDGPVRKLVVDEVEVLDVGARKASHALVGLGRNLDFFQPNIVIPSLPHVSVAVLLAKILSQRNHSVVVWERNIYRPEKLSRTPLKIYLLHLAVSALYRFADGIVFNSPMTEQSFRQNGILLPSFSLVLPNLVDEDIAVVNDGDKPPAPQRFVLAAGRLTTQKGFDILIKSFRLVDDGDLHLLIAGQGPDESLLRQLALDSGISERVHFLGFVSNLRALMSNCEFFVLSSRWEGFGNVIVEALQEGAQVLSFDCPGGPSWILGGGRFGILVPNGSERALARAINDVALFGRAHPRELVVSRGDEYRAESVGNLFFTEVIGRFAETVEH